ncbi:hypothetical protein [Escherichia Stx1 converting phage]|uniref:Uncharacterized protein n=1 Tax=Escherichia phage Stx2 II TaxID=194949 RepID=Q7Y2H3_9CAUD|nr:hypothetical protein Stx1_p160 [Escherichia Stx1 converting phage]NP_859410.1 hypothetical protein Stx2II_p163 [Escherichia phage Stx2 II]BAC77976.1 hypothetical protein [Escherichia Stx1 converting phage]BAC78147.1 hypothetical protein [Escherichia phage Stx2 II]
MSASRGPVALSTPEVPVASRTVPEQVALIRRRLRPAATSARRVSFSALASANSLEYFASSAATSRWRTCMSVMVAFACSSSLAFLSRCAL